MTRHVRIGRELSPRCTIGVGYFLQEERVAKKWIKKNKRNCLTLVIAVLLFILALFVLMARGIITYRR